MGDVVGLVAVKAGMFPEPLAAKPIAVLEFVHVNVAPVGELVKTADGIKDPGQATILEGTIATGVGFTTTTAVEDVTVPHEFVITTS